MEIRKATTGHVSESRVSNIPVQEWCIMRHMRQTRVQSRSWRALIKISSVLQALVLVAQASLSIRYKSTYQEKTVDQCTFTQLARILTILSHVYSQSKITVEEDLWQLSSRAIITLLMICCVCPHEQAHQRSCRECGCKQCQTVGNRWACAIAIPQQPHLHLSWFH